jgi:hypothetical protein
MKKILELPINLLHMSSSTLIYGLWLLNDLTASQLMDCSTIFRHQSLI